MHKLKSCIFLDRPILTDSHNFFTCILMSLYGTSAYTLNTVYIVGNFGEHCLVGGSHLALAEFKFGDLNNKHAMALIGMYTVMFKLAKLAKLKPHQVLPLYSKVICQECILMKTRVERSVEPWHN